MVGMEGVGGSFWMSGPRSSFGVEQRKKQTNANRTHKNLKFLQVPDLKS